MEVYILTLRENDQTAKILKNLGVFSKPSSAMRYLIHEKHHISGLGDGRFPFITVEALIQRESEIGFKPARLMIFETAFYVVHAELSFLN